MKHLNLTLGVACILLLLIAKTGFSQSETSRPDNAPESKPATYSLTVKGIIKDETGKALPGVSIYLKGTTVGTISNDDGSFEFPRKLEPGDRLTFSFIGRLSEEYLVESNADDNLSIVMNEDVGIIGEAGNDEVYTSETGFRRLWSSVKKVF